MAIRESDNGGGYLISCTGRRPPIFWNTSVSSASISAAVPLPEQSSGFARFIARSPACNWIVLIVRKKKGAD
jgi:hypothetical protein